MSDKQKKLFLLLLPAAIILFLVFAWFELKGDKPKIEETKKIQIDIPDIPNNEKRQAKEEIFAAYERKEMNFNEERKNIKSDKEDFFGLAGKKSHNDIEELYNKESEAGKSDQEATVPVIRKTQSRVEVKEYEESKEMQELEQRNKQIKTNSGIEDEEKINESEDEANKTTKDFQSDSGFGIAYGESFQKENESGKNSIIDLNDFIKAELLSDKNIKDNSELVFVLSEEYVTEQYTINKMARLYCKANVVGDRIDIICNTIRNTDGKIYNIKLFGYNENYQKGIRIEGKIDKVVNETNNEALEEGADIITDITGVGSGISDVLKSGTRAMKKDIEILLKEGYLMLFKDEKN